MRHSRLRWSGVAGTLAAKRLARNLRVNQPVAIQTSLRQVSTLICEAEPDITLESDTPQETRHCVVSRIHCPHPFEDSMCIFRAALRERLITAIAAMT